MKSAGKSETGNRRCDQGGWHNRPELQFNVPCLSCKGGGGVTDPHTHTHTHTHQKTSAKAPFQWDSPAEGLWAAHLSQAQVGKHLPPGWAQPPPPATACS